MEQLSPTLSFTSRWTSRLPPFARRALQMDQMELDSALSQMYSLCVKPSLVSKMSKARKMTKNHYHRDDPAFLVLQIFFLALTVVATGCAVSTGVLNILYHVAYAVAIDYLAGGALLATATWVLVNRYFMGSPYLNEVRREVDWRYAFDVHCNGYFTYFMWTRVFAFIAQPVVLNQGVMAVLLANTLFAIGLMTYVYNVFIGYLELPVLRHQQKLLYPIPFIPLVLLIATLLRVNCASWAVAYEWQ